VHSPNAHILIADSVLQQGTGRIFAFPLKQSDEISIIATAGTFSDTLNIKRDSTYLGIIQGQVFSHRDSTFLSGTDIFIKDSLVDKSDNYGTYTSLGHPPGVYDIRFFKKGYKPLFRAIKLDSGEISCDTLYLSAVHGGIFHHRHMILDPGFNEELMGGDSACFILSHLLQDSLSAAGSEISIIGSMDDSPSVTERIGQVNDITSGWYMGIKRTVVKSGGTYLQAFVYPGNAMASVVADSIGAVFKQQGFRYNLTPTTQIAEIRNTNKTAVGLSISAGKETTDAQLAQWIFTGLAAYYRGVEFREETKQ
jgi:hypothetical protein